MAFVVSQTRVPTILALTNFDEPHFRLMKEKLECALFGYRIPRSSPFRTDADGGIQQVLEAGLYELFVQAAMRYVLSTYSSGKWPVRSSVHAEPLGWSGFREVFFMLVFGMLAGTVAFGVELVVFRTRRWRWYGRLYLAKRATRPPPLE